MHYGKKYYVKKEVVAEELGVEPETVLKWHREKKIPSVQVSRKPVLFDLEEVRKALSNGSVNSQKNQGGSNE